MEKTRSSISKHEDRASRVLKARIADPPPDGHGIMGEINNSFDLPPVSKALFGLFKCTA
jgi:hypothetical protein